LKILPRSPPTQKGRPKKRGKKKKKKALNLFDKLDKYRREALAFMHGFEVPFDNDLA